jgi:hypothetical protein
VQLVRHELLRDQKRLLFADLVCTRADLESTFCRLADEVLADLQSAPLRADVVVKRVLNRWRELLDAPTSEGLGLAELLGLFGELKVLGELLDYGLPLECWTGADPARHDFRIGDDAVEVKTSLGTRRDMITVNGLQQLVPPAQGRLLLRRFRVDRAPDGSGIAQLVQKILATGLVGESDLRKALKKRGYHLAHEPQYADARFEIRDDDVWWVDERFPRISPASFIGGVIPMGVEITSYQVDLSVAAASKQTAPFPSLLNL